MNGEDDKDLEEMGEGITVTSEEIKATAEKINHPIPTQNIRIGCSHKVVAVGFNTFYYSAEHRRY